MSSPCAPSSPLPGSPITEANVAAKKENTSPRISSPHAPLNGADNTSHSYLLKPVESVDPGEVIQVPSTAPAVVPPARKPAEANRSDQTETQRAGHIDEASSDSDTVASEGAGTDLPVFDWVNLQQRYTKAIQAVNQEEEDILEEFYRYSDSFSVWGGASANRDNERASKRLRTRENFVRLGEASLEEKKEHYVQVVDAFRKALELLSR